VFDIGFWEILVIAVVLLLVMGPERLPEVAKQAAFLVRKARQGMFRLRSEMKIELDGTPFSDLQKAKQEMSDFKNDMKQFGRDLADSADKKINIDEPVMTESSTEEPSAKMEPSANKEPSAKNQSSSTASK
jgi:sec-independent protein translocase protein TatB